MPRLSNRERFRRAARTAADEQAEAERAKWQAEYQRLLARPTFTTADAELLAQCLHALGMSAADAERDRAAAGNG